MGFFIFLLFYKHNFVNWLSSLSAASHFHFKKRSVQVRIESEIGFILWGTISLISLLVGFSLLICYSRYIRRPFCLLSLFFQKSFSVIFLLQREKNEQNVINNISLFVLSVPPLASSPFSFYDCNFIVNAF